MDEITNFVRVLIRSDKVHHHSSREEEGCQQHQNRGYARPWGFHFFLRKESHRKRRRGGKMENGKKMKNGKWKGAECR